MSTTPVGSRLYVNGAFVAEAPNNPPQAFAHINSTTQNWTAISNFNITMPNIPANHGATARVDLLGVNNAYAGRVWRMNHRNAAGQIDNTWQDIIFYVPYQRSSAEFSFTNEGVTTSTPGSLDESTKRNKMYCFCSSRHNRFRNICRHILFKTETSTSTVMECACR